MNFRGASMWCGVMATAILATGCTVKFGGTAPAKVYKAPQETVAAAAAASQSEDYKTLIACFSEEARDTMAGQALFAGLFIKGFAEVPGVKMTDDQQAQVKRINDTLKKHGLTEDALKKLDSPATMKNADEDNEATRKVFIKMVDGVKDRQGFFVDMLACLKSKDGKTMQNNPFATKGIDVKDVTTEGDKAKGTLVSNANGKEHKQPIKFKKEGDSWKIDSLIGSGKAAKN